MPIRGLGRGLDSLIPTALKAESAAQPGTVPISQIRANRYQPRQRFNEESLRELADSIREQGLIQPLIVAPVEQSAESAQEPRLTRSQPSPQPSPFQGEGERGGVLGAPKAERIYELIAGERRWRAAKMAGLTEIPVLIKIVTEKERFQFSLIENIQREDLNPIEEARAFKRLMEEFHLTQEILAKIHSS